MAKKTLREGGIPPASNPVGKWVCALLEPIGLRALAAEAPNEYVEVLNNLRAKIEIILANNQTTTIALQMDKLFLQDNNANTLIELVQKFRIELLRESVGLVIRGVIVPGKCNFEEIAKDSYGENSNWRSPKITLGFLMDESAARAYGELEKFKGAGIMVSKELREDFLNLKKVTTLNWFISDSGRKRFAEFYDLSYNKNEITPAILTSFFSAFKEARHRSRKLARFYIPALINWIKSMEIESSFVPEQDDEAMTSAPLDTRIINGAIKDLQEIPGYELAILALYERWFSKSEICARDETRRRKLFKFLKSAKKVQQMLRVDDHPAQVPEEIMHQSTRRYLATLLAGTNKNDIETE